MISRIRFPTEFLNLKILLKKKTSTVNVLHLAMYSFWRLWRSYPSTKSSTSLNVHFFKGITKLIRIKRQFKFTLNSQKLKFRQISYTLNIIRLQYLLW